MGTGLWDFLRARAVEVHVPEHLRARLQKGELLRFKLGMDPTAPDLHVGHLVLLDVLRRCQDEGHTVVLIVGDATALIGDPSGRSETRPMLSREQVDANAQTYHQQLFKVLDRERTEVHGNSEWLLAMGAADVLKLLGQATLQQVLQREDFATRLRDGNPIGAHEILYPFNQAYDSVAVRADVEIGGTDQLFNLLFGRDIQRAYGQEPQDIAVFPLLEGLDGSAKMSKSLGNYIGIAEPPEEIYGKAMSIPDTLTARYLRLISGLAPEEVERTLALGPYQAKHALASQLVRRLDGEAAAAVAAEDFARRFSQRQAPAQIEDFTPADPGDLLGTLVELGWARSRGDARRLCDQSGVRVDGDAAAPGRPLRDGEVLQAGKRKFVRIRLR